MNGFKVINEILSKEAIKAATFARKIGITPTQIYDLQKGKIKGVSSDIADKIIEVYPHYDKSWIMTGLGNPLKESPSDELSAARAEINTDSAKNWDEIRKKAEEQLNMLGMGSPMTDREQKLAYLLLESTNEASYWKNKCKLAEMNLI